LLEPKEFRVSVSRTSHPAAPCPSQNRWFPLPSAEPPRGDEPGTVAPPSASAG
ncbi:hypothetical protein P7K49_035777, partial [Saguinus oedipus]